VFFEDRLHEPDRPSCMIWGGVYETGRGRIVILDADTKAQKVEMRI
jgi:hypothetical protein